MFPMMMNQVCKCFYGRHLFDNNNYHRTDPALEFNTLATEFCQPSREDLEGGARFRGEETIFTIAFHEISRFSQKFEPEDGPNYNYPWSSVLSTMFRSIILNMERTRGIL